MMGKRKDNYCCSRFKECVEEGEIIHSTNDVDETEWYIPELWHLYYCPFCGAYIKGKGFGKPPSHCQDKK